MGCDIHIYAERFNGKSWTPLGGELPYDRNYRAFALLADVRNDGFITPISQPRGLPTDTSIHDDHETEDGTYLGDHSFSWLLLSELRAIDLHAPIIIGGMLSPGDAEALDQFGTIPQSWCKSTSQSDWQRRTWQRPLKDCAGLIVQLLEVFKDETEPTSIRFVFGFDN